MVKYLQIFLNPIFGTFLILVIVFSIQYSNGAKLAFQVVEVYDSGLQEVCQYGCDGEEIEKYPKDCYYYGGCFNMTQEKSLIGFELTVLVFYLFSIFNVGREIGLKKSFISWLNLGLFIFAYFLFLYAKQSDWFGSCSDFCGFGTIFFFPMILFFLFLAGIRIGHSQSKKLTTKYQKITKL